jgi:TolA-binding protein
VVEENGIFKLVECEGGRLYKEIAKGGLREVERTYNKTSVNIESA